MKKYRITSIPQSLPKAQTGKSMENRLKMKRQKYGSKQKDSNSNYGRTDYKGGNLNYNFADAFHDNIYKDKTCEEIGKVDFFCKLTLRVARFRRKREEKKRSFCPFKQDTRLWNLKLPPLPIHYAYPLVCISRNDTLRTAALQNTL